MKEGGLAKVEMDFGNKYGMTGRDTKDSLNITKQMGKENFGILM